MSMSYIDDLEEIAAPTARRKPGVWRNQRDRRARRWAELEARDEYRDTVERPIIEQYRPRYR